MYDNIRDAVTLSNGMAMPRLGLGVFKVNVEEELQLAVKTALEVGYCHIDTAQGYDNEDMVGRAVHKYKNRKEVFITSKLHNERQDAVEASLDETLRKLGTDYLDLFLIHWPSPWRGLYVDAWKEMVRLYEAGRVRAIGVSNFNPEHIEKIYEATGVMPMVNQVERHPIFQQKELEKWCEDRGIILEAWAPLTAGHMDKITPALQPIAAAHGKTVAQVILRWQLQSGWVLIPKSTKPQRIAENADIFDFELSDDEMAAIAAIDTGKRMFPDPVTADF